ACLFLGFFFFQAEDGIRDRTVTGVQTCALPIYAMSKTPGQFVICVRNDGHAAALETRKIYVALRDPVAEKHGQLRIIDESGDDYLYPKAFFRTITLPQSVKKAVLSAA